MDYIARVLPSLGEDSVTLRSTVLSHPTSFASPVITLDPPPVAAIKGSLRAW